MFWFEHCFLCDGGYGDICDYNDDDHAYDHDCDDHDADAGMLMIMMLMMMVMVMRMIIMMMRMVLMIMMMMITQGGLVTFQSDLGRSWAPAWPPILPDKILNTHHTREDHGKEKYKIQNTKYK